MNALHLPSANAREGVGVAHNHKRVTTQLAGITGGSGTLLAERLAEECHLNRFSKRRRQRAGAQHRERREQ